MACLVLARLRNLIRGYSMFVIWVVVFSKFFINVVSLDGIEVCPFAVAL